MSYALAKAYIIEGMTQMLARRDKITLKEARDKIYTSSFMNVFNDNRNELYGDSVLSCFALFEELENKPNL